MSDWVVEALCKYTQQIQRNETEYYRWYQKVNFRPAPEQEFPKLKPRRLLRFYGQTTMSGGEDEEGD